MPEPDTETAIEGRYVCVPNPCTTRPCLPGMACAVECEGQNYVLTVAGRWFAQSRSWSGWTPSLGDRVKVIGRMSHHVDVHGDQFVTIEPRSIAPCS